MGDKFLQSKLIPKLEQGPLTNKIRVKFLLSILTFANVEQTHSQDNLQYLEDLCTSRDL